MATAQGVRSDADVVPPPLPVIAAVPPAVKETPQDCEPVATAEPRKGLKGSLLDWGALLTVTGGLVTGVVQRIGGHIWDAVWPYVQPYLHF